MIRGHSVAAILLTASTLVVPMGESTATPEAARNPDQHGASEVEPESCTPLHFAGTKWLAKGGGLSGVKLSGRPTVRLFRAEDGTTIGQAALPPGWTPLTASEEELKSYGFLPRPALPSALTEWRKRYANFRGSTADSATAPCMGTTKYGNVSPYSIDSNGLYSGLFNEHHTFTATEASIKLPPTNVGSCSSASSAAFWVGTSDQQTQSGTVHIDQTGFTLDPQNNTGYLYWFEMFPDKPIYPFGYTDVAWSAGQVVRFTEAYSSENGGTFTWTAYNQSTGQLWTTYSFNSSANFGGAWANFVVEQVSRGGVPFKIRNYGSVSWQNGRSVFSSGSYWPSSLDYVYYKAGWGSVTAPSGGNWTTKWAACQ